ncbi:NAD(+)/NADH kinase [Patescibacteria group bacterium]|nr:NAD(+)/NADH kinase [Patescibacteria group bacterium]MBU1703257.1 NAD(+)/NADH kinase [Patescibacteria group bacterium]MBU1953763.1 NAD(+)/NADH kinase [Patescibacteria group bacterium]
MIKQPKKKFKKVGILAKKAVAARVKNLDKIVKILRDHKAEVFFDEHIGAKMKSREVYTRGELLDMCDLVLVLGGDGTILKTAGQIGRKKVLVLAVNYGNLGFLSESHPENLEKNLEKIFKGRYFIDKRSLLRITHYRNKRKCNTFVAMNDAVINQGLFARLIELNIDMAGSHVVKFKADGMIISTPTGSTAHSLSAGGPIVHPALNALIITPICPAPLTLRPIVIPNDKNVTFTVITQRKEAHNLGLTIDGQITIPLEFGDTVKARRSRRCFYMIRFEGSAYYKTLREKLGWGRKPNE